MEKLEKNSKISKINSFSRKGYDKKGMKSTVVKKYKNRIIFIKQANIYIVNAIKKTDKDKDLNGIIDIKKNIEKNFR